MASRHAGSFPSWQYPFLKRKPHGVASGLRRARVHEHASPPQVARPWRVTRNIGLIEIDSSRPLRVKLPSMKTGLPVLADGPDRDL